MAVQLRRQTKPLLKQVNGHPVGSQRRTERNHQSEAQQEKKSAPSNEDLDRDPESTDSDDRAGNEAPELRRPTSKQSEPLAKRQVSRVSKTKGKSEAQDSLPLQKTRRSSRNNKVGVTNFFAAEADVSNAQSSGKRKRKAGPETQNNIQNSDSDREIFQVSPPKKRLGSKGTTYGKSRSFGDRQLAKKQQQSASSREFQTPPVFAGEKPKWVMPVSEKKQFKDPWLSLTEANKDFVQSSAPKCAEDVSESDTDSEPLSEIIEIATPSRALQSKGRRTANCPLCGDVVFWDELEEFNDGMLSKYKDKARFCRSHKSRKKHKEMEQKYPKINWSKLSARIRKYNGAIQELLDLSRPSFYRGELKQSINNGGVHKAFNSLAEVDSDMSNAVIPGYYGTRGARIIHEHILDTFGDRIRSLATTDAVIPTVGVAGYVQYVLARELAVMLVMDDYNKEDIGEDQARRILLDSVELGQAVNADFGESTQVPDRLDLTGDDDEDE